MAEQTNLPTDETNDSSEEAKMRLFEYKRESISNNNGDKKYSKGLREISRVTEDMGDVAVNLSDAISSGARRLRDESDKSAKKRKNGALVEIIPNLGKSATTTLRAAADIPEQIGDALDTKSTRRFTKGIARLASNILDVIDD